MPLVLGAALALLWGATLPRAANARRKRSGPVTGKVGPAKTSRWPRPLVTRDYLSLSLRYDRGRLIQRSIRRMRFSRPRLIKRVVGRFLAKIYRGKRLLDVLPFNFPLLAPAESFTRTGHRIARRMEANLRTATRIKLPYARRMTRIEITDVATSRRWAIDLRPLRRRPRPRRRPASRSRPRP